MEVPAWGKRKEKRKEKAGTHGKTEDFVSPGEKQIAEG
jgi:hypothetical protein